ncbi:MAG: hypothetical protein IJ366_07510 [Clostridia bacterium]|nr:hypothetical protein [Clostridia bacterium]
MDKDKNTLTKEIMARVIADAVLHALELMDFEFSDICKDEGIAIANEVQQILYKYGFDEEHEYDEATDFNAIEDIVRIYENHGYSSGVIHDF